MSPSYIFLMIIVLTIPMFLRGKIGVDMLLNLKTYSNDTTCNESKCVNACDDVSCHQNENCQMINHIPSCECLSNFTRNNEGECLPITTCLDDFTCGSSEFCSNGKCVNACNKICGPNEKCQIFNHNSTCECLCDFIRNNEGECKKIKKCARIKDCDSSELCINGICIIECNKKCDVNEICQGKNRTFSCECIPNYRRDFDNKCKRQCSNSSICKQNEDCKNGLCKPVVIHSDRCGLNAVSIRVQHQHLCTCPRGFGGDPYQHCLKRCKTNYECEDSEICHINLCMNTCSPFLRRCPYTQKCEVKNHTVNCLNETSKYKSCTTTTDCDKNSFCTAKESLCIPLCDPPTCPDGERCEIISEVVNPRFTFRSAECRCNFPLLSFGGSLKCFKPCDTDEICEENEYCYFSNWCVPRKHQPLV